MQQTIRYHAHFFVAAAPAPQAPAAPGPPLGNGELLDVQWAPLNHALHGLHTDAATQIFVLEGVRRLALSPAPAAVAAPADGVTPFLHYRGGRLVIDYEPAPL